MGNSALKKHCANAEKTGVLNISKNNLNEFPSQMMQLQSALRTLDVSQNKFNILPKEIGKFTLLKTLILDSNSLSNLPEEIGNLKKLEHFSLQRNRLRSLPRTLSQLSNLKQVNLHQNQLMYFPMMFCGLKHLDIIDLSCNKLTEIPEGVAELYVTELNLNQNQISVLPRDIANCPRLKTLRVEENCLELKSIPVKILSDSKVSTISVEGNLFEMKQFMDLEGYDKYMERYTAVKKKLF